MCPNGMFVESMKCERDYCDNLRLRCCMPQDWTVDFGNQQETEWFSEDGGQVCPDMLAVIGAQCKDDYCASLLLYCAPVYVNPTAGQSYGSWATICSSNVLMCSMLHAHLQRQSL